MSMSSAAADLVLESKCGSSVNEVHVAMLHAGQGLIQEVEQQGKLSHQNDHVKKLYLKDCGMVPCIRLFSNLREVMFGIVLSSGGMVPVSCKTQHIAPYCTLLLVFHILHLRSTKCSV